MKAEENKIAKIIGKYRLSGKMTDNRIAEIIIRDVLNEVSRDDAVDFELRHVYKGASKTAKKLAYMQFDEWKSKQEQL